ncbi:5-(carboxyamino)imidazole ribonucleotide mutase [Campylobacter geochelonis]|uniref:N5-carboxyaminoimidazole ribonucleotide mutase n=1 Tax=Campylobacter geochelonis TaxID=1780362 RepID=A0A128ERM9_9BACT|nr:5-(carboxyamino)imidazole ribonucleotide mutase [Campylobacter geochelonis]QKF70923.1 5-aminoimidazole ribonucleotide (AIR) carboxylase [Campylobacter geochelonis]CZE46969.1 phosphoribosylaminoimidazole carboxylase%2C catalytic subunit [Campylobacter geochelonis]CZE49069.1 phosphoribosylaminoimidazole carboxylase%2C catalytic subunit [Campylobacter geochelonis]CZE51230.1 phosphoribosylaminoimidazole carboxylase%2C catalytic subunit [Campylobacter geochelonis]
MKECKFVSIIMGSKSDYDVVNEAVKVLEKFGVAYELIVSSAHRSPERTAKYIKEAEAKGAQVFICAAGMAAHLAGVVCSKTLKPVLGIPVGGGALNGVDALYSTVQMPGGMPVGTLAIGKAGAKNAAYLAVQILSLSNLELASKLKEDREAMVRAVEEDSAKIEVLIKGE